MEDRELLELAAKAAGYDYKPQNGCIVVNGIPGNWNPLDDDGDALRLAVKLGLCVIRETIKTAIVSIDGDLGTFKRLTAFRYAWEPLLEDPYTATRRAIVRAAAAIGEAMP